MQTLRNAHLFIRLVLVWFALFIGVSVTSPLVKPPETQMVCSVMGMKMVDAYGSGDKTQPTNSMDCPLCLPVALPFCESVEAFAHVTLSYALQSMERGRLVTLSVLPWQARAPPFFLITSEA
jgi:hypothetical protein